MPCDCSGPGPGSEITLPGGKTLRVDTVNGQSGEGHRGTSSDK